MQPFFLLLVWLCALGVRQAWAATSNKDLTDYARQMDQYAAVSTEPISFSQSAPAPSRPLSTQGTTLRSTLTALAIPYARLAVDAVSLPNAQNMQTSFSAPVSTGIDLSEPVFDPTFFERIRAIDVPSISITSTPIEVPSTQTGNHPASVVANEMSMLASSSVYPSSVGRAPLPMAQPQGATETAMDLDLPRVVPQSSRPLVIQALASLPSSHVQQLSGLPSSYVQQPSAVYAQPIVSHATADDTAQHHSLSVPASRDVSYAGSTQSLVEPLRGSAHWLTELSTHGPLTSPASCDESFVTSYFPPVPPSSVHSVVMDHQTPSEESSGQLSAFEQLQLAPWQSVSMESSRSNVALSTSSNRPALARRTSGASATSHVSSVSARYSPYPRSVAGSYSTASSSVPHLASSSVPHLASYIAPLTRADETLQDTPTMTSMSFEQRQMPQRASTLDGALDIPTLRSVVSESSPARLVPVDTDAALDRATGRRCERCRWVFASSRALQQHFLHHLIIEAAASNPWYRRCVEGSQSEDLLDEEHDLSNFASRQAPDRGAKGVEKQRYASARALLGKESSRIAVPQKKKASPSKPTGSASVLQSFACRQCNETLSGPTAMNEHLQKHVEASQRETRSLSTHHRCTWCDASLANLSVPHRCPKEPSAYRQAVEKQRLERTSAPSSKVMSSPSVTTPERRETNLETVAKRLSGRFMNNRSKESEAVSPPDEHPRCARCNLKTYSASALQAHMAKHEQFEKGEWFPPTTYRCKLCDKRFAYKGEIYAHDCPKAAGAASSSSSARGWSALRRRFDANQFDSIKHGLKK